MSLLVGDIYPVRFTEGKSSHAEGRVGTHGTAAHSPQWAVERAESATQALVETFATTPSASQ